MFYFNDSWVSFYVGDIKISISAWFVMAILVIICLIWQDRVLDVSKATLGRISPSPKVVNFIMISGMFNTILLVVSKHSRIYS